MPDYAQIISYFFALGMVVLHVILVLSVLHRLIEGTWLPSAVSGFVERWGLVIAAVFPVAAVFSSLWYSEIVGLPVCVLCWFTRTMMYPLAVILPIAAWRKDRNIWLYVIPISLIGLAISGYQHLMQMGVVEGGLCHALSGDTDCAARYVFEFGYITMPLFATTMFTAIAFLTWLVRKRD